MFTTTRKSEAGFTLVELAIVLMIIGLLIGGILRGQELMENARVTSTIQQTKAYDGATTTFRDSYSALPGDIRTPDTRLPNCAGACATAGDNNSIIGAPVTSKTGTYDSAAGTENRRYWLHLAVARLISGVDASNATDVAWGVMFPAAKIGGGFHVVYANIASGGAGVPGVSGHFLILRNAAASATLNEAQGASALSPLRAAQIDRKLDDGLPRSGDVVGIGGTDCVGATYIESSEQRDCNLLIRVQN